MAGETVFEAVENVANDCAGGRSDDTDDIGQVGQGFLWERFVVPPACV